MMRRSAVLAMAAAACGRAGTDGSKIALRYHPPAGAVYHYALEQSTQVTMRSGPLTGMGQQQLKMRMHFTQTIQGPAANGSGTEVEVVFDSTTMEMPGVPSDAAERELARMRGLRSTVVFDERAQIVSTNFAAQPGMTPAMANQMGAGIKAMTFAFPEQPIGPGDSWTVTTELPLGQVPGTNASGAGPARTTLTVRGIRVAEADTSVLLDIKTQFPSGPIELTFAGQRATLKMSGELAGNQQFSLSRGAVVNATLKGAMTMNITAAALGSQAMVMLSETENTLRLLDGK